MSDDTPSPAAQAADNPAVRRLTAIPPAVLEAIAGAEGNEILRSNARVMLATQMDLTHRVLSDPRASTAQRLEFIDKLAKIGDAYPKATMQGQQGGPGFSVQIVFNKEPKSVQPAVIDVQATEIAPTAVAATEGGDE